MELKAWLDMEIGRQARLAEYLTKLDPSRPVTTSFLTQMKKRPGDKDYKPVPARLAVWIEKFTGAAVMRWDLCPDEWHYLWPELKDRKGSPDLPASAESAAAS